jgi:drug/metabolite transporter (DMT)-like permease
VFGLGLGAAVFGERPDALMLAGCAVVVLAGVYALVARNGSSG